MRSIMTLAAVAAMVALAAATTTTAATATAAPRVSPLAPPALTDATPLPPRFFMPWMCLERCGGNATTIQGNLRDLMEHKDIVSAVSYELFNLGAGGSLVFNADLSQVTAQLHAMGLPTVPMISSYPYPPQFLTWMEEVFADPEVFISQALAQMGPLHLGGWNVDWEPTNKTVPEGIDGRYAAFLGRFADALRSQNASTWPGVTVDTAQWSPLWNYTALAASNVDRIITMATYTDSWSSFETQLQRAVTDIPADKLIVGLQSVKASSGDPYTAAELQQKFALLDKYGVRSIALWDMPAPGGPGSSWSSWTLWWPMISKFMKAP